MTNDIPLLGYGKMPMRVKILKGNESTKTNIVTQNEIIDLQRDLNLTNDQLHSICQFMKRKGLRTPNTRYTQVLKKQNVIDLFESAIIELEDSKGIQSPTEVVYCNDIDQLLKRVEEVRKIPIQLNRYGIDHGQSWLKVVCSPIHGLQFVDSVKGALIVAVADCIESPFNIGQIIGLLDLPLDQHNEVLTCDLKVLCQILGIKGGNARYPCPYCLYNKPEGRPGIRRTGSHFDEMYLKFKKQYKCAEKYAKECGGVYRPRIFSNFENPLQTFPIAAVHGILGLREKLLDRIPMKLLGKDEYKRFEDTFMIPLVGPRQQYHGGSYTGDKSKKLIDSFDQINIDDFPPLKPLIPVLQSASNVLHKVFGKMLLEGWEASIQEFRKAYGEMQQRIPQTHIKYNNDLAEAGFEAEFNRMQLSLPNPKSSRTQNIINNLIPSTKLHILLDHLEEFLLLVNADRPDSQLLGLGYFAESVLESSHHSFKDVLARFHGGNKLIREVIEFNAQSIGYFAEKSSIN